MATYAHGGEMHITSVAEMYTAGTLPNLRFPNWHLSELELVKCFPETTMLVLPSVGPEPGAILDVENGGTNV